MNDILFIVIPCYNEEEVLPETAKRLKEKMVNLIEKKTIDAKSKIVFVNDGSKDNTWNIIENLHFGDKLFRGINLSHNKGHQNALLAGLLTVKDEGDIVISMDADLQDDIAAVDAMLEKYSQGCDIVYGVRNKRKKDSFFKRASAQVFYKIMSALGVETIYNHADYRLMSKRALEALSEYKEVNLFLRGITPLLGFKNDIIYYERDKRFAGESKYPFKKMLSFALDGITSFSIKPIRFITTIGFLLFFCSILILIYIIIGKFQGNTVSGWASTILSIWAIGGLQLVAIGVIGEYIGKIYLETKARPRYIIERYLKD